MFQTCRFRPFLTSVCPRAHALCFPHADTETPALDPLVWTELVPLIHLKLADLPVSRDPERTAFQSYWCHLFSASLIVSGFCTTLLLKSAARLSSVLHPALSMNNNRCAGFIFHSGTSQQSSKDPFCCPNQWLFNRSPNPSKRLMGTPEIRAGLPDNSGDNEDGAGGG